MKKWERFTAALGLTTSFFMLLSGLGWLFYTYPLGAFIGAGVGLFAFMVWGIYKILA